MGDWAEVLDRLLKEVQAMGRDGVVGLGSYALQMMIALLGELTTREYMYIYIYSYRQTPS